MAWWRDSDGNLQSGLMICGVPKYLVSSESYSIGWNKFALTASNYLFKQTTPLNFAASKGYIKIDLRTLAFAGVQKMDEMVYANVGVEPKVTVALQFGDYWAYLAGDTYSWDGSFRSMDLPLDKRVGTGEHKLISNWDENMGVEESDGIFIPINFPMSGQVSIYIYHEVGASCADPYWHCMFDMFVNKCSIKNIYLTSNLDNKHIILL
jgi:hypothetical protein